MNKCNKTSAFPILNQYYTKLSFNFIIYSNEKSLSVVAKYTIISSSNEKSSVLTCLSIFSITTQNLSKQKSLF